MKTVLLCSLLFWVASPAMAQFTSSGSKDPTNPTNTNNLNPTNPLNEPGSLDVFSLIHRANLANSKSLTDFRKESTENLTDEVARYRARTPLKIAPTLIKTDTVPTPTPTP